MQAQLVEACLLNQTPCSTDSLFRRSSQPEERRAGRKKAPWGGLWRSWLWHHLLAHMSTQTWVWSNNDEPNVFMCNGGGNDGSIYMCGEKSRAAPPRFTRHYVFSITSTVDICLPAKHRWRERGKEVERGKRHSEESEREGESGRLVHGVAAVCLCWQAYLSWWGGKSLAEVCRMKPVGSGYRAAATPFRGSSTNS